MSANNRIHRRSFLAKSIKASVATGFFLHSTPGANAAIKTNISFVQKPLPYSYQAFEPIIDALTMEIHYSKHAAAYAKNLADACSVETVNVNSISVESLLAGISKYSAKMRNNAGGHYNHEFFWHLMTPVGHNTRPGGKLLKCIEQDFGSTEAMQSQFNDAARNRFGSGWAWLIVNADKKLQICSTPNQDNPLMDISDVKGKPIVALDVWEHAYYLKYQNKRADYITAWWQLVNWDLMNQQLESAL